MVREGGVAGLAVVIALGPAPPSPVCRKDAAHARQPHSGWRPSWTAGRHTRQNPGPFVLPEKGAHWHSQVLCPGEPRVSLHSALEFSALPSSECFFGVVLFPLAFPACLGWPRTARTHAHW